MTVDRLTLHQFARRYGMSHETASAWIDTGTAPARRIPGLRTILILTSWCDAYDEGRSGFWNLTPASDDPIIESPYLRRIS